eukprot:TRINITY_DN20717_c0_g1_i1.p1 TRINITY_DN20717_c0_g1~~TRINITY_DN20717_c0_g1_i1.p1  ORF type:complete len:200 (+),score=23.84 TRINITY_DN20717_c0_g1_i1:85-684(+)
METNLLWSNDQKQLCFQVKQQLQTDDHWTVNLNSILNADNGTFKYNSSFKKFFYFKKEEMNDKSKEKSSEVFQLGLGLKVRNFEEYKYVNRDDLIFEVSGKRAFSTSKKAKNVKFVSGVELGSDVGFNIKSQKFEGHGFGRFTQKVMNINDLQDVKISIGGDIYQVQGGQFKNDLYFQIRENNWGLTYQKRAWLVSYDL